LTNPQERCGQTWRQVFDTRTFPSLNSSTSTVWQNHRVQSIEEFRSALSKSAGARTPVNSTT
jgi:hypothetical protein